jgi:flagellar biosynthesis/type III secretory pathway ATPase
MEAREVLATYRESADLIEVGAYVAGSNPRVDRALRSVHLVRALFQQTPHERHSLQSTLDGLKRALEGGGGPAAGLAGQAPSSAALGVAAGEAYRG